MKKMLHQSPDPDRRPSQPATRAVRLRRWHGCVSALLVVTTVALTACGGGAHDDGPKIDTQVAQAAVDQFRITSTRPGMSAAIGSDDRVLWTGVSGYADADPGSSAFAGMNPKTQTAAVVFSNRNFLTEQDLGDYLGMVLTLAKIGAKR